MAADADSAFCVLAFKQLPAWSKPADSQRSASSLRIFILLVICFNFSKFYVAKSNFIMICYLRAYFGIFQGMEGQIPERIADQCYMNSKCCVQLCGFTSHHSSYMSSNENAWTERLYLPKHSFGRAYILSLILEILIFFGLRFYFCYLQIIYWLCKHIAQLLSIINKGV